MGDTPDRPESETRVEPTRGDQCIGCTLCADVCPADAIDVDPGRVGRTRDSSSADVVQLLARVPER